MNFDHLKQKYVGTELDVTVGTHTMHLDNLGSREVTTYALNENDTYRAMIAGANACEGVRVVRVWLPDTVGTMDLRTDRLNVYITYDREKKRGVVEDFAMG